MCGFVETLEERSDGRFSRTGSANDGNAFAWEDFEVDVLEDLGIKPFGVREGNVVEVDGA